MISQPTQSAVVALVPEVEGLVGRHRTALDPAAAWGVPAHVTVLYPFVAPADLDAVIEELAAAVAELPPVDVTFSRVGWFGEQVLYLAPEPASWFRRATESVHSAFPSYPPYGGQFADVIPHLTVADGKGLREMQAAVEAVVDGLPLRARVVSLALMQGTYAAGSWHVVRELPLRG